MNYYFSRMRVNGRDPEGMMQLLRANGYQLHQLLWALFPQAPEAQRDFLFKRDETGSWPVYYLLSQRQPQTESIALDVESKLFNPQIENGDRFSFSLRANPVRTRKTDDPNSKKRHRDDVVWLLKDHYKKSGKEVPSQAILSQQAGEAWIERQGERHGFKIETVRADSYQQHRLKKNKRTICFSTLDFNGQMIVTDREAFTAALYKGIGPAKAFGCGLMMVRRA